MALAVIAGALNPDQSQPQDLPVASQSQSAAATESAPAVEPTEALVEETASSEPSQEPSATATQTQAETTEPEELQPTQAPASPTSTPTSTPTQAVAAPAAPATGFAALLAQLEIADEFQGGYDRDLFSHWIDADRNGCDARREVLIIEAAVSPLVGSGCSFTGGSWYSAFDGVVTDDPSLFDIDHMVPLKEAWDSGAHAWDSDRRRAFANDLDLPEALIAVSKSSNRSKGAGDPADWLPPLRSYHCQYINDWMVVKIKWELSVDAREFSTLRTVAAGC
jgi:hypothetical protein